MLNLLWFRFVPTSVIILPTCKGGTRLKSWWKSAQTTWDRGWGYDRDKCSHKQPWRGYISKDLLPSKQEIRSDAAESTIMRMLCKNWERENQGSIEESVRLPESSESCVWVRRVSRVVLLYSNISAYKVHTRYSSTISCVRWWFACTTCWYT